MPLNPDATGVPLMSDGGGTVADGDLSSIERRHQNGRRRSNIPVGDTFVSRLGPSGTELFAAIDDLETPMDMQRPGSNTPIEQLHFVALDCETTGHTPHRLVELGAVAFTLDQHLMSFETLVHSTDYINPFARRIHGISRETLGGAPPMDRVLARFHRFIHGAVLVEHSADAFDTRLIAQTLREPLDNDNLDTSRLASQIWDLHDTIGLERLCAQLDVHHRRPHHALADAEATAECFVALIALGRERFGWQTLADLLASGAPPAPRALAESGTKISAANNGTQARHPRRRRGGRGGRGRKPDENTTVA